MTISPQFLAAISHLGLPSSSTAKSGGPKGSNGLSNYFLTHATGNLSTGNNISDLAPTPNPQGHSVISRILDILSRPEYAVADAAMESQDALSNGESFWDQIKGLGTGVVHGLSGTQKHTFADVIQQGKDINAQNKAAGQNKGYFEAGRGAGYQTGQGGDLGTGDKLSALGLNIFADPLNAVAPIKMARAFGEGSQLYKLPTTMDVVKGLSKKVADKNPADFVDVAVKPTPVNNLLDINPKALSEAKSIPDIIAQKIGEPVTLAASHPHVNLDEAKLANGILHPTSLTESGIQAARDLHIAKRNAFNAESPAVIEKAKQGGKDVLQAMMDRRREIPALRKSSGIEVAQNAIESLRPDFNAAIEHNNNWIQEAVKNGIDPKRAIQVVKDVQAGDPFKEAFADAVRNSKPFKGAKIGKAGELKNLGKPETGVLRIARILAPTSQEVTRAIQSGDPAALNQIKQARALNAIKREGYLTKTLNGTEQAIHDQMIPVAENAIERNGAYNDLAQANLWNTVRGRVVPTVKGGASAVRAVNEKTMKIVSHIERTLEASGIRPISADGTPARLTDAVLNHSEFPDKLKHYPNRILNNFVNGSLVGAASKAEEAIKDTAKAAPIVQSAALKVNQLFADPALSDPIKHLLAQRTAKGVHDSILINTGSTRAADAGKKLYKAIQASQESASQHILQKGARELINLVSTGKTTDSYDRVIRQLLDRIGRTFESDPRSLSQSLDPLSAPSVMTTLVGPLGPAERGFLGLMATWAGQHDVRQAVVQGLNTARTNSAIWSKNLNDIFGGLSRQQQLEAIRTAQGMFEAVNPDVTKASGLLKARMENLFGVAGLRDLTSNVDDVATRVGIIRDGKFGINSEFKRIGSNFNFTNEKDVKDLLGNLPEFDFAEGANWLNSWKAYKFTGDVPKELAKIETGVFNYAAKKAIFDNLRYYFGKTVADATHNAQIKDLPFLRGVYFEPELAQQITRVVRDLYPTAANHSNQMLKGIDRIMQLWKTGVTIYSPSHAIRNGMGDIYNNTLAGVHGTRVYGKALRVMASTHGDYPDLIFNQDPLAQLIGSAAKDGEKVVSQTRDGQKLTASQIKMAAHNQGILLAVQHIEDIANSEGGTGLLGFKPFGGKVSHLAHSAVQGMDHFTRLAHFIWELEHGKGSLKEIFDHAGTQVRKFHPDGMDLTNFERNVMRRIIPFYSWSRKAIPFTIEGMFAKPGLFMAYPKSVATLNYGNASNINPGQQFPSDQLFPSWITDNGIGPLGGPGGFLDQLTGGGSSIPSGYVTGSPSIPPIDILQTYANHPSQGILGGLNPIAKVPLELMEGQHIDTQIPITNTPEYLGEQVPIAGLIQRLTNVGLGGVTNKGQTQGVGNSQNLLNFLTGLKLTNTGQYIKEAQYELHAKQVQAKKNNKQNMANFIKSLTPGG